MSNNCYDSNSLDRDGTNRQQRLLQALLPDYVAVDERKIEDLKDFVLKYAREIHYYDLNNEFKDEDTGEVWDWEHFFEKKLDPDQRTEPHYALFLAFLQLFRIAQDDLNQITRKHLDFYYRDVLQLEERKAVADQAFVILKLARHVDQHLLKEGTQLKAGKDDSGNELIYETDRDIVINTATVKQIKAVYKDENSRIYASPKANSADGKGAEIESSEKKWDTFGRPEGNWPNQDRPPAEIGFAFASPLLFLAEGDREITIKLSLEKTDEIDEVLTDLIHLEDAFRVRFSGAEDWIEPSIGGKGQIRAKEEVPSDVEDRILEFLNKAESWEEIAGTEPQAGPVFDDPQRGYGDQIKDYDIGETTAKEILSDRRDKYSDEFTNLDQLREVKGVGQDKINDLAYTFRNPVNRTKVDIENNEIKITRTITKAQDPIVAYQKNDKKLLDPFKTDWPVVKITLCTDQDQYVYKNLQGLNLNEANISVHVSEVRELIIQNDQSILDPGKNFQPFGIRPDLGSNFYIGNREVFSKELDMLKIHLSWHGLPDNFGDYYTNYIDNERANDSFESNISLLDKKSWVSLESGKALFDSDLVEILTLTIRKENLKKINRDIGLEEFDEYDTDTRRGFVKLELAGTDFGHKDYQKSYTEKVLNAVDNGNNNGPNLPNEPYTPQAKEIYLDYESSVEIDLSTAVSEEEFADRVEQFFHVGAFGVAEQKNIGSENPSLFPQYRSEGTLYIGVQDFTAGQTLSLLFQVAEGSADPELEPQEVNWSFLSDNEWIDIGDFSLLSDGTSGLLTSGIINFEISKEATEQNTLLPSDLHWIRATVEKDTEAISDLIEIIAQAVPATFKDRDNDPDHLKEALPAETISKLKVAESAIDEISQPFSSFGGKVKEQKSAFYTRVSERLRHKNRSITIWDYERLVLEEFPSVYKAKCLNHTRYTGSISDYSEMAPGHVTLIVVSNVKNKNAVDPLRPKTSLITLTEIHDYISEHNSDGVTLHLKNPIYEEIQVELKVRFREGFDDGFYGKKLEDDIKAFLSPWAFEGTSDLVLGGKIHKSMILNYVEERRYVDFLTCFEMYHIVKDPATDDVKSKTNVDEAEASTSVSILGSVGQAGNYGDHKITVLETDDCECEDNVIPTTASILSSDECPSDEDQMFET